MANKIRVLGLDDDNHSMCYATRSCYYSDAGKFMKECLLDPHTIGYEVRQIHIIDLSDELVEKYGEDEVERMFDLLACENRPDELLKRDYDRFLDREKAFDTLWEYAEKEWYYA